MMMNLIDALMAVIGIGIYALLICWIVKDERKIRDLERDRRARSLLHLEDKPYMLPKQAQDHEIKIVRKPSDPEPVSRRECINTAKHVEEV